MEPLNRLLAQLRTFWAGLSTVRRVLIVGATAAVFLGVAGFGYLNQSGDYVPLYSESLSSAEVAEIQTKLKAANVPHKLKDPHTITVPTERHAEATVVLAGEGIPARGKGLESFDQPSMFGTPFQQTVNYQRALQTELSRQIGQIDGVVAARVMIARPEPSPFVRDQVEPTASVVLKLKPNTVLNRQSAASIVSLVSHAVVGLKAENVTVVDSNGRLLSDPHAKDRENIPAGQLEYLRDLEAGLAAKAQDMLIAHLGRGRAVVQVSAEINTQKSKERLEQYSPEGKVVSAERLINSTTSASRAGGVTGAVSNIRPAGGGGGGSDGTSKEETIQTDYAVSKTVRETENRIGAVKQLSIAAFVDLTPPAAAEGQPAPVVVSAADAEEIIKQAIGFQAGRGDKIKVTNVRLSGPIQATAEPDEEEARVRRFSAYVALTRNISLAVAVVMAVSLIPLLLLRRRSKAAAAEPPVPLQVAPPGPTPDQRRREMLDRFVELARSDPDRTASVFGLLAGTSGG